MAKLRCFRCVIKKIFPIRLGFSLSSKRKNVRRATSSRLVIWTSMNEFGWFASYICIWGLVATHKNYSLNKIPNWMFTAISFRPEQSFLNWPNMNSRECNLFIAMATKRTRKWNKLRELPIRVILHFCFFDFFCCLHFIYIYVFVCNLMCYQPVVSVINIIMRYRGGITIYGHLI